MLKLFHPDPVIFVCAVMLICIGLAVIASVMPQLFWVQLIFTIVGLISFFLVSGIDYRLYLPFSKLIYFFTILSLLVTVLIGIVSRGAARWVEVFGFRFQFSELLKPLVVVFLAYVLSRQSRSLPKLIISVTLFLPIAALIFMQPDLGSAIVYTITFLGMLIVSGIDFRALLGLFVASIAAVPVVWNLLVDYQRQRIVTFFNPGHDVLGSSYNAVQSIITVGSGMIWGKGLGRGTQSHLFFLPEKHTDFIFASFSEEMGFFGGSILLILYFVLLTRVLIVFKRANDVSARLITIGIMFIIFSQAVINIGMNIGLLPITGITLPLVSYGGSSMIGTMIALGIVSNVAHQFQKSRLF